MDIEKYRKIFIQESDRYLKELTSDLLRVEKDLLDQGLWSDIHGKVHSIKGMARGLSLNAISDLCHAMETWCKAFQEGSAQPTSDAVEVLMEGADLLNGLITSVARGGAAGADARLNRIRDILTHRPDQYVPDGRPIARSVSAPSGIDYVRVEYTLIEELLARSQEIVLLEKTLPPLSHEQISAGLRGWIDHFMALLRGLHFQLARLRLMPVQDFVSLFDKPLRDLARNHRREVRLEVAGGELQVDIGLMERLREPFLHLLRNAIAHGIEPPEEREAAGKPREGRLAVRAEKQGDSLMLTVADDGRGIDPSAIERYLKTRKRMSDEEISQMPREEFLRTILQVDFSSASAIDQLAGRGIGMDVVAKAVEYLSGSLSIHSEPGKGTRFVLKLPLSLSIIHAIVFQLGRYTLSVPTSHVLSIELADDPSLTQGADLYDLRKRLSIKDAAGKPTHVLRVRRPPHPDKPAGGRILSRFSVDRVLGNVPLMVMPAGELLSRAEAFAGVGIMENGDLSILLNMERL